MTFAPVACFRPSFRFHTCRALPSTHLTQRRFQSTSLPSRLKPFAELARLDKPIGSWLLYWPCAWSLTMAATPAAIPLPSLAYNLALFGAGAVIMRGAGCTINDMWDTRIDRAVERTKLRPLAAGTVTRLQAWTFLGLQLSAGLAILAQLNWPSIFLGASSLAIVVVYPLMKRITHWPQLVLGTAFNWGALLGPMALISQVPLQSYLPLYAGSICWTIFYDTIYAHQDKVDDVAVDVRSTALLFGEQTKPVLTGFASAFVGLLAYSGSTIDAGLSFYLLSVGGTSLHLAWQLFTVNLNSRTSCWQKFASNRNLGFLVWSGMAVDYCMRVLI